MVDHEARRQIIQLSNEQGRITATLDALMKRMDREGKATQRALEANVTALEALTLQINRNVEHLHQKINEGQVHTAFMDGKNVTRWSILGVSILALFTFIGGMASHILTRVFTS